MVVARVLHAGLQLLDRQLVDRNGRLCGKVDDLELAKNEDGTLYVSAILTGPGALLIRSRYDRLGRWLRRMAPATFPATEDPVNRIPMARVADIGNHVTLSLEAHEVATYAAERWVRDHVIDHIPGSKFRADR